TVRPAKGFASRAVAVCAPSDRDRSRFVPSVGSASSTESDVVGGRPAVGSVTRSGAGEGSWSGDPGPPPRKKTSNNATMVATRLERSVTAPVRVRRCNALSPVSCCDECCVRIDSGQRCHPWMFVSVVRWISSKRKGFLLHGAEQVLPRQGGFSSKAALFRRTLPPFPEAVHLNAHRQRPQPLFIHPDADAGAPGDRNEAVGVQREGRVDDVFRPVSIR